MRNLVAVMVASLALAAVPAAALATGNPNGTGPPSQSCQDIEAAGHDSGECRVLAKRSKLPVASEKHVAEQSLSCGTETLGK